jgi:hypothetical protein
MKDLFGFRNMIAHCKQKTLNYEKEHCFAADEDIWQKVHETILTDWEKNCTEANAIKWREDVEKMIGILHQAAKNFGYDNVILNLDGHRLQRGGAVG